jgi:hypothetical protein
VQLYFWEEGLHRPQHAAQSDWLTYRQPYSDSNGDHELRVRVRLDGVTEATGLWSSSSELQLPAGTQAVKVSLSFEADPKLPLSTCKLAVRDAAGTRYEYLSGIDSPQPISPCVPPESPGPDRALGKLDEGRDTSGDPVRPATWTVDPVITLPKDVDITDVVLWWDLPDYASFAVAAP